MIRGSCRPGSRNRATSGEMASHPTKDSISTDAARPTDHQPCGANGVQFSTRACGAAPSTATATRTASTATSASCTPPRTARPASAM